MKKDKTALTTFVVILSMILLLTACGKSSKKTRLLKI